LVNGRLVPEKAVKAVDVMALLLEPTRIRLACDPYQNKAWKKASQMTTGVDGLMPKAAFADRRRSIDEWAKKLTDALLNGVDAKALALKVLEIPKKEPWEAGARDGEYRGIVIRGIFGRCLSSHLSAILQDTAEPLLPPCAIAYRPERSDMVQRAILRVATAVGIEGFRFYAKLDVADCFNQLPRRDVARAMKDLGYPARFVYLVMASVGATRYRRVQGGWVQQHSEQGCPAGLPESSILVNIFFLAFDRWIGRHCPHLVYFRYSDDVLFVGKTRLEVEPAVSELMKFTKRHGLRLKAVSPNQSPASLVHDVQDQRLVFLGAEIGPDGDVHIPADVLDGEIAKIRYRLDRAAKTGHLVVGQSRYAGAGRRGRGVPTYDGDDVLASVIEFYRYWFQLNQGEAKVFLGRAQLEFNVNVLSGTAPYGKVWVAALGALDNLVGGGIHAGQDNTSDSLERWVRFEVIPLIREVQRGVPSGTPYELLDELADLGLRETSDPGTEEPHEGPLHPGGHQRHEAERSWSTPASDDLRGLPGDDVEVDAKELSSSATGAFGLTAAPRGLATGHETSGATTLGSPPPPGQPSGPDWRLVCLHHQYDPERDSVLVRTDEFSDLGRPLGTWEMTYEGQPPMSAVVEHLLRRLAQVQGVRVAVAMHDAWLAKLLLQDGREFRSLGLFQRVAALHAIGANVVVIGPVRRVPSNEAVPADRGHRTGSVARAANEARDRQDVIAGVGAAPASPGGGYFPGHPN